MQRNRGVSHVEKIYSEVCSNENSLVCSSSVIIKNKSCENIGKLKYSWCSSKRLVIFAED